MTQIKINDEESIEITSQFKESVKGFVRSYNYNNLFEVKVKTSDDYETSFNYHISIDETQKGKKVLNDNDHICAFDSFVGDAIAGCYDFEQFMDEFGYTNCKEGYKTFKLCQKATKDYESLNIDMDIYVLSTLIREKYPEVL